MVQFTEKGIVITIPSRNQFEDYIALQSSLFEVLTFVIKNSFNHVGEVGNIYQLEVFAKELTNVECKQCLRFEKFIDEDLLKG